MKYTALLFASLFCLTLQAQNDAYNMVQLGHWDNDSLPSLGTQQFSNGWGWADSATGREYAIFGSIDSTYFIDVTDPANPVVCDVRPGRSFKSVWREYKTYSHYCYAVADYGQASLQIFDLQYLPDSVSVVYDSDSLIVRSHTVYVDKDRLYCNSTVLPSGERKAVTVLSLQDPEHPQLLGHLEPIRFDGSPAFLICHDAFVRNDTLYCNGENPGVFIYDVSDMDQQVFLGGILEYPERGYNHSGYLSDDGQIYVFTDENHGLGIKAYDVSDLNNMELLSVFRSHSGAMAHNPYFIDRTLYVSYYHDGVYVFDLSDAKNPKITAWFDTYPQNGTDYAGFEGCWGIYPYLPSGNLLAFDMTNGLFVLEKQTNNTAVVEAGTADFMIYPNPGTGIQQMEWDQREAAGMDIRVFTTDGKEVYRKTVGGQPGRNRQQLDLSSLKRGMYLVQLTGAKTHICRKLLLH